MRNLLASGFRAASRVLLAAAFTLFVGVALNAQVNAVYVESNISNPLHNSILGFSNDGFGNLTPLDGSPYLTQGTGWAPKLGDGLALQQDDDQQIVINSAGTYLYAVNGRSNTISEFSIKAKGGLALVGSPVPSGGTQPASIGLLEGVLSNGGSLMVVVNKDSDPVQITQKAPNIASVTINTDGTMTPNANSKVVYPVGTSPSQAMIANGKLVMIDEFMASPSQIEEYRIHADGSFTSLAQVRVPAGDTLFLGMVKSPVSNYFFVGLPEQGMVAAYSYVPASGVVTFASVVSTPGLLPCWLAISADGKRLYSGDTQSSSISVYDVSDPTSMKFLQQLFLTKGVGNGQPWNVKVDPTGQFLYAITGVGLHAISIQPDGTLLELATPTLLDVPSNTYPYGLATLQK
ncbi:MAG: beta-propeller fold lactonase family protein [Acidobacteriales bacterium]|nr:beta-propeller fold lactonase family protein [Terriglobales bacterium]